MLTIVKPRPSSLEDDVGVDESDLPAVTKILTFGLKSLNLLFFQRDPFKKFTSVSKNKKTGLIYLIFFLFYF